MRKDRLSLFATCAAISCLILLLSTANAPCLDKNKKIKILHVMSYHSSWEWNKHQFQGFKDALHGLDVEYKLVEMDSKKNSSKEWKKKKSLEAKRIIQEWKPDLVYCNDDSAQEYVAKDYVGSEVPFVFSAVNESPEKYGFNGSNNTTGVMEHEHFVGTVALLKKIAPDVKKIAVIVDPSPMWKPVIKRMRAQQDLVPGVEIVSIDTIETFSEFKDKVEKYQDTVDALGLLGIFEFKDQQGDNVAYEEVLGWVSENSGLPDFSYWESRIACGTLCAVAVSGYEQGLAAGKIARGVLVDGRAPASYAMLPTLKGEPIINLTRAKKLGLKIDSSILLTTKVITTMDCR